MKTAGNGNSSFGYDGDGMRVKKSENGANTFYVKSSVLGQTAMEVNSTGVLRAFVYSGGKMVAMQGTDGQFYWLHTNHLGNARTMTDANGIVAYGGQFDPYGQPLAEWSATGNTTLNTKKFTGYERDAATGLDYAQARMYNSSRGRFTSPDSAGLRAARAGKPQSLNRYAYVGNDPVNYIDQDGRIPVPVINPCGWAVVCASVTVSANTSGPTSIGGFGLGGQFEVEEGPKDSGEGGGSSQQTQALDKTAEASNILGQFMGDNPDCDAKFLGLGLDYRTIGTGNSTIKVIDPNGDPTLLNMTLGQLGVTTLGIRNDKLSDWVVGNDAFGFTIWETGTIYLGDSFKLQSPQEQRITIAHELLHAHVQGSEAKILNRLGVTDPRTGEVWDETDNRGASAGIDSYLKSGCQKATL